MEKIWLPLLGGIVVGAAVVEIVRRTYPGGLGKLSGKLAWGSALAYHRVSSTLKEARQSFVEGYKGAAQPA